MQTQRAGLIGVTGYTGMELARLLAGHPSMRLVFAASRAEAGKRLGDYYPFLERMPGADVILSPPDPDAAAQACDVVFLAVPHGAAMELAAALHERGVKVVDLSADFRLRDATVYEDWYKTKHTQKPLLHKAVYGLPELHAAATAKTQLVANPGCYPSAAILGLYPALRHKLVSNQGIIIDAKSGVSGAGRKAAVSSLFCEVADTFKAYNLGKHRHTPEIEQEISAIAGENITVSFNTHLLPINRGILSTIYTQSAYPVDADTLSTLHSVYCDTYAHSPFVRILPQGSLPETRNVRGTLFCDIGLVADPRTGRIIIVSAIDNLCRGASGQALANANIVCGLPMNTGLTMVPFLP